MPAGKTPRLSAVHPSTSSSGQLDKGYWQTLVLSKSLRAGFLIYSIYSMLLIHRLGRRSPFASFPIWQPDARDTCAGAMDASAAATLRCRVLAPGSVRAAVTSPRARPRSGYRGRSSSLRSPCLSVNRQQGPRSTAAPTPDLADDARPLLVMEGSPGIVSNSERRALVLRRRSRVCFCFRCAMA